MDCEVIDNGDDKLQTKKEYEGRLILIKNNTSEDEDGTLFLKCHSCNCLNNLEGFTVDHTNDIVTITEEILCGKVSCAKKYHVTMGKLIESA